MYSNIHHCLMSIQLISFQNAIPSATYKVGVSPTQEDNHHPISNEELMSSMKDCFERDNEQFERDLSFLINHCKIKPIMEGY